jgi:hypothetical protein
VSLGPCADANPSAEDSARQIDAYEQLRGAVLRAQARPEGLAAVTYHGVLGGLKVICARASPTSTRSAVPGAASAVPSVTDPALVRLLANMILFYKQEVSHVV